MSSTYTLFCHVCGTVERVELTGGLQPPHRCKASPGDAKTLARAMNPYIAINLLEALKLVPDTGDWHGMLRLGAEQCVRDHADDPQWQHLRPNSTAEQMRERLQ